VTKRYRSKTFPISPLALPENRFFHSFRREKGGIIGVKPMDCEKIREKFSSLLEGDLSPFDEKMIKEHLSSCPECQKDFETFKKTMNWLHSVEELEAPEGFLTEIYQKMEDRKRMETRHGWVHWLSRMNLPAQAVAMVAIVFVVLYITKMIPMETSSSKKVVKPVASSVPLEKKTDQAITTSISAPIQEIVLRTSDPGKSLSELRAMVKQFGGEIVKEEENALLASLPTGSLSEFKKEMEQRSISKRTEVAAPPREAPRTLKLSPKAKEEVGGKEKEMERPTAGQEGRITVRFLVIRE
jgi:hypothetical protein